MHLSMSNMHAFSYILYVYRCTTVSVYVCTDLVLLALLLLRCCYHLFIVLTLPLSVVHVMRIVGTTAIGCCSFHTTSAATAAINDCAAAAT
jgi:hypothetical protein